MQLCSGYYNQGHERRTPNCRLPSVRQVWIQRLLRRDDADSGSIGREFVRVRSSVCSWTVDSGVVPRTSSRASCTDYRLPGYASTQGGPTRLTNDRNATRRRRIQYYCKVTNPQLSAERNFDRGFDRFVNLKRESRPNSESTSEGTRDSAIDALKSTISDRISDEELLARLRGRSQLLNPRMQYCSLAVGCR